MALQAGKQRATIATKNASETEKAQDAAEKKVEVLESCLGQK